MQEPKVTRIGAHNNWTLPDKEWLEDQYIIQGKIRKRIATEIGADPGTVGKWLDELGILQRKPGKVKPAKLVKIEGILMRPPASIQNGKLTYWSLPDKAWLEYQYVTLDKSADQIGKEIGTNRGKVLDWVEELKIPKRTREEHNKRHSDLMKGSGNPAYNGGTSRSAQNRFCVEAGKACICSWCGVEGDYIPGRHETSTPKCSLDLHHKDYNPENGNLDNLVYLCPTCHKVATALHHLKRRKKAKVTVTNKIITIDFNI